MLDSEKKLVQYNFDRALSHLLAIEEHMSDSTDINNLWCAKKHSLLVEHHIPEAIIHLQKINPQIANKLKKFNIEMKEQIHNPNLEKIRDLRNEFREIIQDPTLGCKDKICSLDQIKTKSLNNSETFLGIEDNNTQFLNNNFKGGAKMVDVGYGYKGVALLNSGQVLGKLGMSAARRFGPSLSVEYGEGAVNVLGGALLQGLAFGMRRKLGGALSALLAVAGSHMVSSTVYDVAASRLAGSSMRTARYPSMRIGLSPSEQMQGTPLLNTSASQELTRVD